MKDPIWPAGKLPKDWQRVELEQVKELGYTYDDPRELVTIFENKIAEFAGSKYAVAVDNCTDAVFLSLCWTRIGWASDWFRNQIKITIPNRCYCSIPIAIAHAGALLGFENLEWEGVYQLKPFDVWDGAARFTKGMYKGGLHCLSFQIKKILPIGKGGMILTDNAEAVKWLRQASFEGRHLDKHRLEDTYEMLGWNMYMPPEDAARGLILFDKLMKKYPDGNIPDMAGSKDYADMSQQPLFQ